MGVNVILLSKFEALYQFCLQALNALPTEQPDVVLMDINMPGMNGLGVLEEIRDRWPACRTMLMTGAAEEDTRMQAIKLGALDFLDKPLDWQYLELRFNALREDFERTFGAREQERVHCLQWVARMALTRMTFTNALYTNLTMTMLTSQVATGAIHFGLRVSLSSSV